MRGSSSRAALIKALATVLAAALVMGGVSCTSPQTSFSELYICSQVDQDFSPISRQAEYDMYAQEIYATIKVNDVPSGGTWRYRWIDQQDGSVLAESSGRYMERDGQLVSGYFANLLKPDVDNNIIALPGTYRVEFYHNQELVGSGSFAIKEPQASILEARIVSRIKADGSPGAKKERFLPGEDIFLSVELDYLLEGLSLKATLYRHQVRLGEAALEISENSYEPAYRVMELSQEILPPGPYKVDLNIGGSHSQSLEFNIIADTNLGEVYQDPEYGLYFDYPDWFTISRKLTDESCLISLTSDFDANIYFGVWAVEADLINPPDRPSFADEVILKDIEEGFDISLAGKKEDSGLYTYIYEDRDGNDWKLLLSMEDFEGHFYIFLGLADNFYAQAMGEIYEGILGSLRFEAE